MFAGIKIFWARLRVAWAKMSLSRAPKHVYACEHKLYCYINITLEGIEKIKTEKNYQQTEQNSLNNHTNIYKLNGFYFSLTENAQ